MSFQTIEGSLFPEQLKTCSQVGERRIRYAIENGLKKTHGGLNPTDAGAARRHFLGCCSEYSTAWKTNLFWNENVGIINARDVGGYVEVRYIERQGRRLIIHADSADDAPFVLVIVNPPRFELLGWQLAGDVKRKEFWSDPTGNDRPAYFVPRHVMRPMSEIFPLIADHRIRQVQIAPASLFPPLSSIGKDIALSQQKAGVSTQ